MNGIFQVIYSNNAPFSAFQYSFTYGTLKKKNPSLAFPVTSLIENKFTCMPHFYMEVKVTILSRLLIPSTGGQEMLLNLTGLLEELNCELSALSHCIVLLLQKLFKQDSFWGVPIVAQCNKPNWYP